MDQLILPLLLALLFLPLILSFRRQRRAFTQMQQLQTSLEVGDRVMTTSGMYGTIVALDEETIEIEIAPGTVTTWVRQAVRERVTEDSETTTDATTQADGDPT